jgi:titin
MKSVLPDSRFFQTTCRPKKAVGERPYVDKDFEVITADEHTSAELVCKIIGRPLPDIKWYRYGKEIVSGRKHKMRSDGEEHVLTVADLGPADEGHYTIIATNNVGACEVEATLLVNCTPQFDKTRVFRDSITVNQGNNLRIQVPYLSRPKPKAKWTYDSRPVETQGKSGESKEIETTDKYTYLLVRDAVRKDSGVYKCTIENKMGKLNCKIHVNVLNVPSKVQEIDLVDTTTNSATIKFDPPKDNGGREITNYIIEKMMIVKEEPKKPQQQQAPPPVEQKPVEQTAEGEEKPAEQAPVAAPPAPVEPPKKKWRLVTGTTLQTTYTINDLEENQAYYFRVSAENSYGISEPVELSQAVLIRLPMNKSEPPTNLEVRGITDSGCMLSWKPSKKDGGNRCQYWYVYKRDNRRGNWIQISPHMPDFLKETCFAVSGLVEGNKYDFRVVGENNAGLTEPSEEYGPVIPKSGVTALAPKVMEYLHDLQGRPGDNVTFLCRVTGNPKPIVKWFKNGREISGTDKLSIREGRGNVFELIVGAVDTDDEAEYSVRAVNQSGAVTMKAKLTLQLPAKTKLPMHINVDGIRAGLHDCVDIKVPLEGVPQCDVTWMYKGKMILPDSRHRIYTGPQATILTLTDAQRMDTGMYVIQAKNRYGNDQCSVDVLVTTVPEAPEQIKISDVERDSVVVSWKAPQDTGGLPLIKYTVEMCPTSSETWTKAGSTRKTDYTIINLSGRTTYKFRVMCESEYGMSAPSEESDPITTKEDKYIAANYDDYVQDEKDWQAYKVNTIVQQEPKKGQKPEEKPKVIKVTDKYQVFEELGRGDFGVVHRAVEIKTQKNWAIKFVKCDDTDRMMIKREGETMKILQHPNLMQLYEVYEFRSETTLVCEFLSGVPLMERIANAHYEFNEDVCIHLTKQLLAGLEFMHAERIAHLDLVPQNIIFTTKRSNTVKIIDFGQAQKIKPNESYRLPYKNAEYRAPEVVGNNVVGTQTDIWSLGCIVYAMLSGISPFKGESDEETRSYVVDGDYDFHHEIWQQISIDAIDFISKCIKRERLTRMKAKHALGHKWFQPVYQNLQPELVAMRQQPLNCQRHRAIYNDMKTQIKETETAICGEGTWAFGGSIRSLRGYTMAKLKGASVDSGPQLQPMPNLYIKEGDVGELKVRIDSAQGDERITWFKNNIKIDDPQCKKYNIEHDGLGGIGKLYIMDINKNDDGQYRARVDAAYFGSSFVECEVAVETRKFGWTRTDRQIFCARKAKRGGRGRESFAVRRPPEFTLPLYNRSVFEGEDTSFACTVTVHPDPIITWLKDGQKITVDGKHFKTESTKGLYQLLINKVTKDDIGNYSVHAKNPSGEDTCTATLNVEAKKAPEPLSVRPMFRRLLGNVEIDEGYFAKFEIRVKGFPKPDLKWEKDGKQLYRSEHIEICWEDDQRCYLMITNVFVSDSGLYKVTATNSAGTTSCQATLTVKPCVYQKRKIRENADRIEAEKRLKLAQRVLGKIVTTEVPLPEKARQALKDAQSEARSARQEGLDEPVKTGLEGLDIKKHKQKVGIMPYNIPEAREIPVVVENKNLLKHEPLSNMKWYREAQIMNEKLGTGKVEDRSTLTVHKKHTHVKQVLYPETDGIIPPRRPKNYDRQHQFREKIERVADILMKSDEREEHEKQKKRDEKENEKDYLRRKIFREESDDEQLLAPVETYLDERRAQEIIEEEKYGFEDPHFKTRAELREGDEEFNFRRVKVPDRRLAGKTLEQLNERRDGLRKRTKRVEGRATDDGFVITKEDEMLRKQRADTFKYESGPDFSGVKGTAWKALEAKYKPISSDSEDEEVKKPRKNPYLDDLSEDSDELYGIPKRQTRVERFDRNQKRRELSPEQDYMKTVRRRHDPELDELDGQVKKLRKTTPRYSAADRSPSLSPERFKPTRGEYQGDLSEGVSFSAKRLKSKTTGELYTSQPAPCIQYKPEFQLRLRKKTIPAGQSCKFTCSIRARPDPKITWIKQESGIILENGPKYTISYLAGVCTLTINRCENRDMGTYRVTAKNASGETSDYAQLEVTGADVQFKDNKLPDSKFGLDDYELDFWTRDKAQAQAHIRTPSEVGSLSSQRDTVNMPYFVRKPDDQNVEEGDSVIVYASCDAKPTARVTWTHDGLAVQDGARVRIRSKGTQYRLEIDNVKFTDAGMYKIIAENSNGKAFCNFKIDVNVRTQKKNKDSDLYSVGSRGSRGSARGPKILQALQGQVRLDGTFRLECSVLDQSAVRDSTWYQDDMKITAYTDRVELSERSGIYTLTISDLKPRDAGSYACHFAGMRGDMTTTQFSITKEQIQQHMSTISKLKARGGSVATTPVERSLPQSARISHAGSIGSHHSVQMEQVADNESYTASTRSNTDAAPVLEPLPSDVDCSLGRALCLTTSWKGQVSKVQWFANGLEVEEDDRIRIDTIGCTSTLSILNSVPDDAGLYRITVRNDHGSDTSEAVATIH